MARKKKKAASSKSAKTKAPATLNEVDKAFISFRIVVDAVEAGGLRYALSGATPEERVKRLHKLTEKVKPIAERIRKLMKESTPEAPAARAMTADSGDVDGSCAEGYYFCQGVCVPWPCPDNN